MTFDVVRGNVSNIMVINELVRILSQMAVDEYEETLYLGYPLSANINGKITVDALLVSERYGIVAFIFSQLKEICDIKDEQDELYFQFINTLTQYPGPVSYTHLDVYKRQEQTDGRAAYSRETMRTTTKLSSLILTKDF